jgi:putative methyltransferase
MSDGYNHAATALDRVWAGRGSVNEAVLGKHNDKLSTKQRRFAYALVCETLKFNEALDIIIAEALPGDLLCDRRPARGGGGTPGGPHRKHQPQPQPQRLWCSLAYVMCYDLLLSGRRKLQGGGSAKRTLLQHESALVAALERLLAQRSVQPGGLARRSASGRPTKTELRLLIPPSLRNTVPLPRYARVNVLKGSMEAALTHLRADGWRVTEAPPNAPSGRAQRPPPTATATAVGQEIPRQQTSSAAAAIEAANLLCTPTDGGPPVPQVLGPPPGVLWLDPHVPTLLVFPHGTDLHAHPLVVEKRLLLQDKASCIPATALLPGGAALAASMGGLAVEDRPAVHLLDACAAPGNKTLHLGALLHGDSSGSAIGQRPQQKKLLHPAAPPAHDHVWAFERSAKRLATLRTRLETFGGAAVCTPMEQDWLQVDPSAPQFRDVAGVLVDPSCSGSGMPGQLHVDAATGERRGQKLQSNGQKKRQRQPVQGEDAAAKRLAQLANFQREAVLHAMRFPSVRRVVYSTCSVHVQENEDVVAAILAAQPVADHGCEEGAGGDGPSDRPAAAPFVLVEALPSARWGRRGLMGRGYDDWAHKVLRCDPHLDGTHGFFVAVFERDELVQGCAASPGMAAPPLPLPFRYTSSTGASVEPSRCGSGAREEEQPEPPPRTSGGGSSKTKRSNARRRRQKKRRRLLAEGAVVVAAAPRDDDNDAQEEAE